MSIRRIVQAAILSTATGCTATTGVTVGNDRLATSVESFMQSINDPNVRSHGRANLLYDGDRMVVVDDKCGPNAVRVFLNQSGNDLVALFSAYTGVPDGAGRVKQVSVRSTAGQADIDDASQKFVISGKAVGAQWYTANGGPIPTTTDVARLRLQGSQSCDNGGGSESRPSSDPGPSGPGPSTPSTPSNPGGCGSCNGNNPGSVNNSPKDNDAGGNTPPGFGDSSDASSVINKMLRRGSGPAVSFG